MNNVNRVSPRSPPDLSAIFDEHFDDVRATLRRLGVADSNREDLVHEVFLKVPTRLADYDDTRPLRRWLYGFATVPQIAELLDIPLNTAYSRLRLGRKELAAAVTRLRMARGAR